MLAKFYNNKNQLISMSSLQNNIQKLRFSTVYTNDTIFGVHLFSQFADYKKTNKPELLQQLTNLFNNKTNEFNLFDGLAAYYGQLLQQKRIHNENEFYKILSNDLAAGKTITYKKPLLAKPKMLQAAASGCDNAIGTKIIDTIAPFGKFIAPFGDAISTETKALFNWACPSSATSYMTEFNKINEKLDTIQQKVNVLADDLQDLRNMINDGDLSTEKVTLANLYDDQDQYNQVYLNYMAEVNSDKESNNTFSSFSAYVIAQGGIDKLLSTDAPISQETIKNKENGLIGGLGNQYLHLKKLNNELPNVTTLIKAQCMNSDHISGDVIAQRNFCNALAIETGARIAAHQQMAQLKMLDAVSAMNTSATPEAQTNPFGNGKAIKWKEAPDQIVQDFNRQMESINTFYSNTLIKPTEGLPPALLENLNAPGNPLHCAESTTTPSGVTGIIEWHANSSLERKYIITNCVQSESEEKSINSRYYYQLENLNVTNVLGTLIAKSLLTDHVQNRINLRWHHSIFAQNSGQDGIYGPVVEAGIVINGTPYSQDLLFMGESSNVHYDVDNRKDGEVLRQHWKRGGNNAGLSPDWIRWYGAGDKGIGATNAGEQTYLKRRSPNALEYSIWVPQYFPDSHVDGNYLYLDKTTMLSLPVKMNIVENGVTKPWTQWVTFGFTIDIGIDNRENHFDNRDKMVTLATVGLRCFMANCRERHNDKMDQSIIVVKLDNGKYIDIWLQMTETGIEMKSNQY